MASDSWLAAGGWPLAFSSPRLIVLRIEKQAVPLSQKCLMGQPVLALTSNLKLFLHGVVCVPAAFPLDEDEGDEGDGEGDDAGHLG